VGDAVIDIFKLHNKSITFKPINGCCSTLRSWNELKTIKCVLLLNNDFVKDDKYLFGNQHSNIEVSMFCGVTKIIIILILRFISFLFNNLIRNDS